MHINDTSDATISAVFFPPGAVFRMLPYPERTVWCTYGGWTGMSVQRPSSEREGDDMIADVWADVSGGEACSGGAKGSHADTYRFTAEGRQEASTSQLE